jgi:glycosyltransferase involved in cell wall biosynthesis
VRAAIDVTPALVGTTGVARHARELLRALPEHGVTPLPFAVGRGTVDAPPNTVRVRVPLRVVQQTWTLLHHPRAERFARGAEVVHSLDLLPPPTRLPLVATVHDLVALEHPALHPPRSVSQQRAKLAAMDAVDLIMASSRATADALVKHGVTTAKIEVVPLGVSLATPSPAPANHGVPFVLAVGAMTKRKGLDVLARAFAALDAPDLQLVLAGPPSDASAELDTLLTSLDIRDRTRIMGAIDDEGLAALYRDASALCFPSHAEGFGLPVLEAMAAGCPVVVSDLPVLRELVGDAGIFVPPADVDGLRCALHDIVTNRATRDELARAGRARASAYSWDATAAATADVYTRAVSRSRRS